MRQNKREYYLDWIRVIVVLLLVPFHTAVSFSHIGKGYIYSAEPVDSFFYVFLSDFLNLWFMRMLFFISGMASFMALKRRTEKEFIVDRVKRLLLPILFVLLTIGPCSAYLLAVNHYGFIGNFLQFYPNFFIEPKKYLFWGHMWFCLYLLVYSFLIIPLHHLFEQRNNYIGKFIWFLSRGNHILLPMFFIMLLEALLRPYFPGYQSFWGDWANVIVYFSFYLLGYSAGRDTCLIVAIHKKRIPFLAIAVLSTVIHIVFKRFYIQSHISSIFWGSGAYSWVMFFLSLFRQHANKDSKVLQYLSRSSFSLYVFHYLILSLFNFILLRTGLNHYIVWSLTTLGTYGFFFLLYKSVLKKFRVLRFVGGIKV
nr:acyltransferase family protein [Spirochaeta isovalerica]